MTSSRDQTFGSYYVCVAGGSCVGTLCVPVYRSGAQGWLHCCVCVPMYRGNASKGSGVVSRVHVTVGSFSSTLLIYTLEESMLQGL